MKGVVIRAIVLAVGLLLVGMMVINWNALVWGGAERETNDAQLRGNPIRILTRVSGYVADVPITDDQAVPAGALLYRIEDREYRARVDQAAAALARSEAATGVAQAQIAQAQAQLAQADATRQASAAQLTRAHLELVRQQYLLGTELALPRAYDDARAQEEQQRATLRGDDAAIAAAQADIGVARAQLAQARAARAQNAAALALARINLGYTRITAPVAGTLTMRQVRRGAYIAPGTQLITLVPLSDVWAVANYREEQVRRMRVGQPASVRVDAFPGAVLHGQVSSLQPDSEATSAALPPDRATGNFTKIVQRVPVKITFDPGGLAGRLVPGLSVETTVDASAPRTRRSP